MHELGEFESEDPSFSGKNRRYSPIAAYCQSKLVQVRSLVDLFQSFSLLNLPLSYLFFWFCKVMFTSSLHKKLPRKAKIDIIAIHPGEVVTNVVN